MNLKKTGQSSVEYLLLIGGALAIAVVILGFIFNLAGVFRESVEAGIGTAQKVQNKALYDCEVPSSEVMIDTTASQPLLLGPTNCTIDTTFDLSSLGLSGTTTGVTSRITVKDISPENPSFMNNGTYYFFLNQQPAGTLTAQGSDGYENYIADSNLDLSILKLALNNGINSIRLSTTPDYVVSNCQNPNPVQGSLHLKNIYIKYCSNQP